MKGTIDYYSKGFRIPGLLNGIVLMLGTTLSRYQSRVDQSILLYVVITLFDFERRLHNVGAVCSEDTGAPNDRFLGNDLKWLVMHPGVL